MDVVAQEGEQRAAVMVHCASDSLQALTGEALARNVHHRLEGLLLQGRRLKPRDALLQLMLRHELFHLVAAHGGRTRQGLRRQPIRGGQGLRRQPIRGGQGLRRQPIRGGKSLRRQPMRGGQGLRRQPIRGGQGLRVGSHRRRQGLCVGSVQNGRQAHGRHGAAHSVLLGVLQMHFVFLRGDGTRKEAH